MTIDIPDQVLKEAMEFSGATTKLKAVVHALEEYNRRQRMAVLAKRLGTFKRFMTRKGLDRLRAE